MNTHAINVQLDPVDAAMAEPGFRLRTGMPWDQVRWTGSEIIVEGNGKRLVFDRLVIASGDSNRQTRAPPRTRLKSSATAT